MTDLNRNIFVQLFEQIIIPFHTVLCTDSYFISERWLPQLDSNQRSDTCIALSTSVTSSSLDCLFNTFCSGGEHSSCPLGLRTIHWIVRYTRLPGGEHSSCPLQLQAIHWIACFTLTSPLHLASLDLDVRRVLLGGRPKRKGYPFGYIVSIQVSSNISTNVLGIGIAFTRCYATDNSLDCRPNAATPLLVSLAQARWFEAKWGE